MAVQDLLHLMKCESVDGTVIDGQAKLKIFKGDSSDSLIESYNGNDQNVIFHIGVWPEGAIHSAYGTVTVNFTNGKGSGVFILEIE